LVVPTRRDRGRGGKADRRLALAYRRLGGSELAGADRGEARPRQIEDQAQRGQGNDGYLGLNPTEGEISAGAQDEGDYGERGAPTTTAARSAPPTDGMVAFAEKLAKEKRVDLPAGYAKDFETCRRFLDYHTGRQGAT
jgi:hypothetical protein